MTTKLCQRYHDPNAGPIKPTLSLPYTAQSSLLLCTYSRTVNLETLMWTIKNTFLAILCMFHVGQSELLW